MKTLYVATHNKHKIQEIGEILSDWNIIPDNPEGAEETADTFVGNALIKVRAIAARHTGAWCLADDSGLEVEALNGAPGVRSARYSGEGATSPSNNDLLLRNLKGVQNRRADFACAIAIVTPNGEERTTVQRVWGRIADAPRGAEGFGYDPLFIPEGFEKSYAELTAEEKNAISHRAQALTCAREILDGNVL